MQNRIWVIVRFPNGSWSGGGRADDPDYANCEIFKVAAQSYEQALKKAQGQRRAQQRKLQQTAS
ncbi:hypothetical protein LCGC14_0170540 [marine sediment metagenome]|jgi:cytochrome c556|uniref:Uncharacterized protein n=1 Tax=marine sediment metagenome TaxID=412755 RepID=A0A0F9USN6_9ZZZZ